MSSLKEVESNLYFPSPIAWFKIENSGSLNQDIILETQVLKKNSQGISKSNKVGWHSETDLFRRNEPCFKKLCEEILNGILSVTRKCAPSFDPNQYSLFCDGWINVNSTHAYNSPHRHSGYIWSGTYYVNVPESDNRQSGAIEFADPRYIDKNNRLPNSPIFKDNLGFKPTSGTMVIFPSYLLHWVTPNEDKEDKISIAFNARFRKK